MTKRLFAYCGLTMLAVYTVAFYFGFWGLIAAAAVAAVLLLYALIVKNPVVQKSVVLFVAFTIAASSAAFVAYDNAFKSKSGEYNREKVTITAKVNSDGVKRYGTYRYELDTERIDTENTNIKILLYSNFKLSCEYGDTIRADVRLNSCEDNYCRSRRFVYSAESDEYKLDYTVIKSDGKDIRYIPKYLQSKLSEAVNTVIGGENGELCSAMTFGTRDELSDDINSMFSKTGLSFLIVISGLHMGIIAAFVLFVLSPLKKLRRGNIVRCVIAVSFILLYMLITGCTVSVVRSGITVILTTIALSIKRRTDAYNSLGLAAVILTIINPYAVGDIGMLLSFSSVLGIVYLYPRLCVRFNNSYYERHKEYYNEILRTNQRKRQFRFKLKKCLLNIITACVRGFFVSLSAVVMSAPIVCLTIGYVNPFVILYSLILTPLTACVVCLTMITAVLYYIPLISVLSYAVGLFADIESWIMIFVVRIINGIPFLTLYVDQNTVWIGLGILAALLVLAFCFRRKRKNVLIAFVLALVFMLVSSGAKYLIHSNNVVLKVIDSGYPTVRITGGGVEALLSFGGSYDKYDELTRKLRNSYGDVKMLVIPDNSLKTSRFAVSILNEFDVNGVMLYHSKRTPLDLEELAMSVREYNEFYTADTVRLDLGQGVTDTLINDGKSTWQYVESGAVSVLIVPDKADVQRLDNKYKTADVIVCGSEINNFDELKDSKALFVTKHDLDEDFNIRLN